MRTSKGTRWSLWLVLLILLGIVPGVFLLGRLLGDTDPPADAEEPGVTTPTGEPAEAREPPVVEAAPDQRTPAALERPPEEEPRPGLRGVVLDVRDGEESPARRILVTLSAPHDDYEATTTTNEAGRFEFSLGNVPEAASVLRVSAAKDELFRSGSTYVAFEGAHAIYGELELRRLAYASLEGIVVDDQGRGLPGARVTIERRNGGDRTPVEVISGPDGHFVVEETRGLRGTPLATLEGYALFNTNRLEAHDERGGWVPLRLSMTRTATLSVKLIGADGNPVPESTVSIAIAPSEKLGADGELVWGDGQGRDGYDPYAAKELLTAARRHTGADGIARFDRAWSGRRLEVLVAMGDSRYTSVDAFDRLVENDTPDSRPLILSPGTERLVEARLGKRIRVVGQVTDPSGEPRRGLHVLVSGLSPDGAVRRGRRERTDEEGRYGEGAITLRPGELVLVQTDDGNPYRRDSASIENLATAVADPGDAVEGTLTVDLVMVPALALAGRVLDENEEPVLAWYEVFREQTISETDPRPARAGNTTGLEEGTFRIGGLEPGSSYELHVHERLPGVQSKHVFPGLVAGSENLELRIATPANVSIRIRAEAEGVELSSCIAILGPVDPGGALATTASSSHELTDLSRWPLAAMLSASGNIGSLFLVSGSEPAAHEWSRVRPGCYQVGIEAWDREKRLLYPIASGPLEFGPGHHELVAHLRPGGSISGRVVGGAPSEALTVALIDERGALLPVFLDGGKAIDVLPVDAKGEFHVELAPTGEFTLIVGSEGELRSGRPRVRQPLTIRPGENAPLSVELK